MAGRCLRLAIGCVAAVCVMLLFFFPLAHGSFQETHGPTTAIRARKALIILLVSIAEAARELLARTQVAAGLPWSMVSGTRNRLSPFFSPDDCAILRC